MLPLTRRLLVGASSCMFVLVLMPPCARAQVSDYRQTAVYRFAQPGEQTLTINAWGAIQAPGLYEVVPGTGLLELVSLAGGPRADTPTADEERSTQVRLVRERESGAPLVFQATLDELADRAVVPPQLEEGDVVYVETTAHRRLGWRDALTVISAVGAVAINVLYILER